MDPSDTAGISVVSNQCKAGGGGFGGAYWNAATFGPDCEVFCTLALGAVDGYLLYARIVNPGAGTMDGYMGEFNSSDVIRVYRIDNAVYTQLGADISTPIDASADQVGMRISGSTINVYVNGVWIDSRVDATYTAAGRIGLDIPANAIIDDFGGGTIKKGIVPSQVERRMARNTLIRL